MTVPAAVVTEQSTLHAYESLRELPTGSEGWGRALLVHRGMVAWIRVCAAPSSEARARTRHAPATARDHAPRPFSYAGLECELTEIVTSMVLAAGVPVR